MDSQKTGTGSETRQAVSGGHRRCHRVRRGPLALLAILVLVVAACLANASPLRGYLESRERLEAKHATVVVLEQGNADLLKEVRAFENGSRVEAQARQDLTYARPGEEVFIVTGLPSTTTVTALASLPSQPDSPPGLLRRLFDAVLGLF